MARRRDLQRERSHQRTLSRKTVRCAWRVDAGRSIRGRAADVQSRYGTHAHRTGCRCRQGVAAIEPHRARFHAAEPDAPIFEQSAGVRSRGRRRVDRFLRSRESAVVRIHDESNAERRTRRRSALVADAAGDVRRGRCAVHSSGCGWDRYERWLMAGCRYRRRAIDDDVAEFTVLQDTMKYAVAQYVLAAAIGCLVAFIGTNPEMTPGARFLQIMLGIVVGFAVHRVLPRWRRRHALGREGARFRVSRRQLVAPSGRTIPRHEIIDVIAFTTSNVDEAAYALGVQTRNGRPERLASRLTLPMALLLRTEVRSVLGLIGESSPRAVR